MASTINSTLISLYLLTLVWMVSVIFCRWDKGRPFPKAFYITVELCCYICTLQHIIFLSPIYAFFASAQQLLSVHKAYIQKMAEHKTYQNANGLVLGEDSCAELDPSYRRKLDNLEPNLSKNNHFLFTDQPTFISMTRQCTYGPEIVWL